MPGPGLNQHDQLDKDEWFSTRGYFFPAASGSLQNWPLSPVGSVSPTSCALFLLNLDLDLDLNLDLHLDLDLDLDGWMDWIWIWIWIWIEGLHMDGLDLDVDLN